MTAVLENATTVDDAGSLQEAARRVYREASGVNKPTGRELGQQFERSERWGRDRIAEVNKAARAEAKQKVTRPEPQSPTDQPGRRVSLRRRPVGRRTRQWRRPPLPRMQDAQEQALAPEAAPTSTATPPPSRIAPEGHVAAVGHGSSGRLVSATAFLVGIGVSVAANMWHAHTDRTPAGPAELIGAAFWPIALFLALEVLTRVPWPARFWWWGFARYAGIGLVALVAFVLSYRHMAGLLTSWGEDWWNAHLGPLAVDGLMLIAATALLAIGKNRASTERKPT